MAQLADSIWLIHTKSGETYTSKTHYPWDVPEDQITSVERIVDGKSIAIRKSPHIHHIFVKSEASIDFVMMGEKTGARPPQVEARIIGCHVGIPPNVFRIELACDPKTGNVVATVKRVEQATQDGF